MKWTVGLCNLAGEPTQIATPRQVGARNDKGGRVEIVAPRIHGAGCLTRKDKGEPGELGTPGIYGAGRLPRNDKGAWCWMKETATKSWRRDLDEPVSSLFLGLESRVNISTRGAFSTGRVPVGHGR